MAVRKALRLVAGLALLIIGLLGLLMPVMPGWIFIIPGLLILADYFPPVRRLVDWAKGRARRAGFHFDGTVEPDQSAAKTADAESPNQRSAPK